MHRDKRLYLDFHAGLLAPGNDESYETARCYLHENADLYGPHPIDRLVGPRQFIDRWWQPLRTALAGLSRQDDILMAGSYLGSKWVAAIGHYRGRFENDWLGIQATGKPVALRFGEFARVAGGQIQEIRTLYDLVSFCRSCGIDLLPPDAGSTAPVPGPATADGVMTEARDPSQGAQSLRRVEAMIEGLLSFDGKNLGSMRMDKYWTADMRWYGPAGIGTTHGLGGFQANHQGPFLRAFPDRTAAPHAALFAEGDYVCVTGWPSVVGTHKGNYLGYPATGRMVRMRVMDFWRCEGDRLAENWVLIDMLDLFRQLGYDLLGDAIKNRTR